MDVVMGLERCTPPAGGSAVTIGAYDGVHLGHQHLIGALQDMARPQGLATAVVTFDRHPGTVVRPDSAPLLLTDLDQKLELLSAAGLDMTVVVPFDQDRANETAEEFVLEVLVGALGARIVVVGEDFHFGHGRKGNVALLADMGADHGFEVVGVGLQGDPVGEVVSSTRIRELLAAGSVRAASELLGRFHQVRGVVEPGAGRGGPVLGFPTANVAVPADIAMPGEGIYACLYERPDGSKYHAAASFGRRPTFGPHSDALLEAFLLDYQGDLYGELAKVSFVERLRDEMTFASPEALVAQMDLDIEAARRVLAAVAD